MPLLSKPTDEEAEISSFFLLLQRWSVLPHSAPPHACIHVCTEIEYLTVYWLFNSVFLPNSLLLSRWMKSLREPCVLHLDIRLCFSSLETSVSYRNTKACCPLVKVEWKNGMVPLGPCPRHHASLACTLTRGGIAWTSAPIPQIQTFWYCLGVSSFKIQCYRFYYVSFLSLFPSAWVFCLPHR